MDKIEILEKIHQTFKKPPEVRIWLKKEDGKIYDWTGGKMSTTGITQSEFDQLKNNITLDIVLTEKDGQSDPVFV